MASFTLRGLPAGSYRVNAESKRVGAFTPGPTVTVRDGEEKTGVEVEMNLAGSIAGTVVDQNGVPVAGVHLRFALLQGKDFGEATTADDGTFKAGALSGGGDYVYEVRPMPGSPIKFRPAGSARFMPIAVRDGDSHIAGVQIKIQFERRSIAGRVVTSDGIGVADATVSAEQRYVGNWSVPPAITDASGAFVITDVPEGRYILFANSPIGLRRIDAVRAGTRNVEIVLEALGTIDGTLEGFTGTPSVVATAINTEPLMQRYYRATFTGTGFSIKNLPSGLYQVTAHAKDGDAAASVTIEPKRTARVVLRNPGFGSIEGRVTDPTRRDGVTDLQCVGGGGDRARPDVSGLFRIEQVVAGKVTVYCYDEQAHASAEVTVERGRTALVELTMKAHMPPARGYSGLQLDAQLSDLIVKAVAASSPAERAGIKVGDLVREVAGRELYDYEDPESALAEIEVRQVGAMVKLALEREGKPLTVDLKLEAAR